MVHNEMQYEFIYQFIHHWFNKINIDDTNHAQRKSNTLKIDEQDNEETESPTNEGYSQKCEEAEGEHDNEEDNLIEQEPEQFEEENPELMLDLINKPPPIERGKKKPKFMF